MLNLTLLSPADIDAAMRLSTQSGWNQLAVDWERLVTLWPSNCLAGWLDGRLVATGTLTTLSPSIGWIGMILVDSALRGQGHGGTLFRALVQRAQEQAITRLGLDATDLGRPVYLKQGFGDHSIIRRWKCEAQAVGSVRATAITRSIHIGDWPAIEAMDLQAVGVDRSALLRRLADEPKATAQVAVEGGRLVGVGFSRAGRQAGFIGPIVASSPAAARELLMALMRDRQEQDAGQPIFADVLDGGPLYESMAQQGWVVMRTLTRMVRPAGVEPLLSGHLVGCGAGFELG